MKLNGTYHYPYPREQVFQALLDPEVLSRTLPGCESLEQTGENQYAGKLKMKVGPVQGVFSGSVELSEIQAPESYRLDLKGSGAPGFLNGSGSIALEEHEGGTNLNYEIDAKVGGKIASIGQRLVESSAKVITKQGLEGLGVQLASLSPASETSDTAESSAAAAGDAVEAQSDEDTGGAPAGPNQAEFAADFVKGMADELVPKERRWVFVVGALLALAAFVAIGLRACS